MELPADHPFREAGLIHEIDVMETLGFAWSTWQEYRTRIPGRTTPNGRWFHRAALARYISRDPSKIDWTKPVLMFGQIQSVLGCDATKTRKWCADHPEICKEVTRGKYVANTQKFLEWLEP